MNRLLIGTGAVALSLALMGCTDNGSSAQMDDSQDTDSSVDFTGFVIAEIDNTSEGRDAVSINDLDFSFNDQDNEQAFDQLF